MLAKNVEVSVVTSALAALLGSEGRTVPEEMVFGYSYREDGHCGDGTPRFNVRVTNGTNEATYAAAALIPQLKVRSEERGHGMRVMISLGNILLMSRPSNW